MNTQNMVCGFALIAFGLGGVVSMDAPEITLHDLSDRISPLSIDQDGIVDLNAGEEDSNAQGSDVNLQADRNTMGSRSTVMSGGTISSNGR